LPAPVEGWDTDTPVAELPPTRAIVLDNWIPKGIALEMRKGYEAHVTGIANAVETLMPYNAGASSTLFAASGANIYNVTSAGAVGAAVQSGLTHARWSYVNFTPLSGVAHLWICNGSDAPRHWNGSAWATPSLTLTSFSSTDIFFVWESKQRLFFLLKNSLVFGYLPVETIAGTVSEFSLGSVFSLGGRLIAGATLTFDGGAGPDDYTVFLSSEGEIAVYQGSNPGDSANWSLVGNFYAGEPIGDRPLIDLDGDVGVITRNGLVPVSQVFRGKKPIEQVRYLTGVISTAFRDHVSVGANFSGWEGVFYPAGDLLLLNAPTSASTAVQFVRHQITGGWTRFTGWNFACFEVFQGRLYAGGYGGDVYLCDENHDDGGDDIVGALQTSWSSLGSRGVTKALRMWRPIVTTQTGAAVRGVARTDYSAFPSLPGWPTTTLSNALVWGEGNWGEKLWGGENLGARQWRSISGVGHTVSLVIEAQSLQSQFALNGIDLIFEVGAAI